MGYAHVATWWDVSRPPRGSGLGAGSSRSSQASPGPGHFGGQGLPRLGRGTRRDHRVVPRPTGAKLQGGRSAFQPSSRSNFFISAEHRRFQRTWCAASSAPRGVPASVTGRDSSGSREAAPGSNCPWTRSLWQLVRGVRRVDDPTGTHSSPMYWPTMVGFRRLAQDHGKRLVANFDPDLVALIGDDSYSALKVENIEVQMRPEEPRRDG